MDETKWFNVSRPSPLFAILHRLHARLHRPIDERKLRFCGLACCRLVWPALVEERSRTAVDVAERFLVGLATRDELATSIEEACAVRDEAIAARDETEAARTHNSFTTASHGSLIAAQVAAWAVSRGYAPVFLSKVRDSLLMFGSVRNRADVETIMGNITRSLRDIFGNPFRPVAFEPAWRTPDVVALARGIYADRAFDRMPILADALQDAGCDSADVLNHCRDADATHVRGCWVVDQVLGKE